MYVETLYSNLKPNFRRNPPVFFNREKNTVTFFCFGFLWNTWQMFLYVCKRAESESEYRIAPPSSSCFYREKAPWIIIGISRLVFSRFKKKAGRWRRNSAFVSIQRVDIHKEICVKSLDLTTHARKQKLQFHDSFSWFKKNWGVLAQFWLQIRIQRVDIHREAYVKSFGSDNFC